jgi:hypothetical protein
MRVRPPLALLGCIIAFAATLVAPALGRDPGTASPSPSPSQSRTPEPTPIPTSTSPLAPVSLDSTPDPQSTGPYPRLLGKVTASAACTRFVEHYNVAVVTIAANDDRISSSNVSLNDVQNDYYRRDGALTAYDHRVQLIGYVQKMLDSIPVEQGAVNDMLAQAKQTTDPTRQKALQESASQLQKSIDRQRALANDLSSVVHVLMDKHGSEDTLATRIGATLPLGETFNGDPGDDPVPQPGEGGIITSSGPRSSQTTVQDVMQFSRQQSIIRAAETRAVTAATRVVKSCTQTSDAGAPTNQMPPTDQVLPSASATPSPQP